VIAAIITAAAAIIGATLVFWKDRNAAARRIQAIDEAKHYIEFWDTARKLRNENAADEIRKKNDIEFYERVAFGESIVENRGSYRRSKLGQHFSNLVPIFLWNSAFAALLLAAEIGLANLQPDPGLHTYLRIAGLGLTGLIWVILVLGTFGQIMAVFRPGFLERSR
jgi:hypothetical protein